MNYFKKKSIVFTITVIVYMIIVCAVEGQSTPDSGDMEPVAVINVSDLQPPVGGLVSFNAGESYDPDGYIVSYQWNFDDGTTGSGVNVTHAFQEMDDFKVTLTVTDNSGLEGEVKLRVFVGRPKGWTEETHHKSTDGNYDLVFAEDRVHRIDIVIDPGDLQKIDQDLAGLQMYGGVDPIYIPVTVKYNGFTWWHVGMRYKGNSTLHMDKATNHKYPLRFNFDKFDGDYPEIKDQRFYGFKKMTFGNNWYDPSFLHEKICADIFRDSGVPAARSTFCRVFMDSGNGPEYWGLYTMIEDPSDEMLKTQFDDNDGNLYKPLGDGADWTHFNEAGFEKKTNEDDADWSDVKAAISALNASRSDAAAWRAGLEEVLDVRAFLRWLAVNTSAVSWDSYGWNALNYYLYQDLSNGGRLVWFPWDLNASLSDSIWPWIPTLSLSLDEVGPQWPLIRFLLDDPVYRNIYHEEMVKAKDGGFNENYVISRIHYFSDLIRPYITGPEGERTGYTYLTDGLDQFNKEINTLINHIKARHALLREYLDSLAGAFTLNPPSPSQPDGTLFPDPALEEVVRRKINKPDGALSIKDVESITWLSIYDSTIKDLQGLEYLTNLNSLSIGYFTGGDISPLAELTSLTTLSLYYCGIRDFQPLSELKALTSLTINYCGINDLYPLSQLTSMTSLTMNYNKIKDLRPLSRLTALTKLYLDFNEIRDLRPLARLTALELFSAEFNGISSIASLRGLPRLQYLNLNNNNIRNLNPLAHLQKLYYLDLNNNRITNLDDLAHHESLYSCFINNNSLTSVAGLSDHTQLTDLKLSHNALSDISPLTGCTKLTYINLDNNRISDLTPLAGCLNLARLQLNNNCIEVLNGLGDHPRLYYLNLDTNLISNLTPLAHCPLLITLVLNNNRITDLQPLAGLPGLNTLEINRNRVSDLSPLASLFSLMTLDIEANLVEDITPLRMFPFLLSLKLGANPITDYSVLSQNIIFVLDISHSGLRDISFLSGFFFVTGLVLEDNAISDLSPLSGLGLSSLDISRNQVTDLAPLSGRPIEYLEIDHNRLTDISALANMPLNHLKMDHNQVENLLPLASCVSLLDIDCSYNALISLDPLSQNPSLMTLNAAGNNINDISVVAGFSLIELDISENNISDIAPLSGMTFLTTLSIDHNDIVDYTPLAGLLRLTTLSASCTSLRELRHLYGNYSLRHLTVKNAGLKNLSGLDYLSCLSTLDISCNFIKNIHGLSVMQSMKELNLDNNRVRDISCLIGLGCLEDVQLTGNPLNWKALHCIIPLLHYKGITVIY
ncbi:MAG: CotH kinase family protein [Spirochaetales bacterium]|nr:CotH kinase family protein [Spirochaetales bacterium]